ncbi:MAG: UDP-N-acetylglucosamine 1-carboxyvinyltransferase [Candidatus Nealsonbacteria bacterium]|nr:UDP-N-acetylglucosamine 1-carboxyvinyltransferase [Candidatus Nealsonbacteria bacterium]
MSDKFVIYGGKPLSGTIEMAGSKNAAGPILAASLLTDEEVIIDNLPLVSDIVNLIEVLKGIGAEIEWLSPRKIRIKAKNINSQNLDFDKIAKTRVSVLLIGPLLARFRNFKMARPGGDKIGIRPIYTHLEALKKLGAEISIEGDFYQFKTKELKGGEVVLKEFSVTATENVMMAAVLAQGKTRIMGAACEPHVQDLGKMLILMGAKIEGLGTHTIEIEGVEKLHGISYKIISDPIEAGTFMIAGCLTSGQVEIKNIESEHLTLFLDKLEEAGVNFKKELNSISVNYSPNLKAVRVQALPYPGFPTDLLPIFAAFLTQAEGKSLIHDPLYENRFSHLQELRKMGADIEMVDPHRAIIFGKTSLQGLKIESWDIRAGAALIIAGLVAQGKTTIENVFQIDRGYEKIEEKLQKLGADIKRIRA